MDYHAFLDRRSADWDAFAALIASARGDRTGRLGFDDLERLAGLHRRVISDYAFARTHFPETRTARRLHQLVFAGHRLLATRPRPLPARIFAFLAGGYARTFRACLPSIGLAAGLFLLAAATGFTLTVFHEEFASLFLGPQAILQLRRGAIWIDSITSVTPPELLSSRIMTNNVSVALTAWAGGVLLGLLTAWILLTNGMMFGAVLAITLRYGLLDRLVDFIAAHGPLELTLVVVASGAGLELARGLIVADVRPRAIVLREHGRRSVRLALGVAPWLVVLGLIEGFVSPRADLGPAAKGALGVVILAVFLTWALAARNDPPVRRESGP